jgi:hypothetical protein
MLGSPKNQLQRRPAVKALHPLVVPPAAATPACVRISSVAPCVSHRRVAPHGLRAQLALAAGDLTFFPRHSKVMSERITMSLR